jgi:putative methanogenesis marker protein 8
MHDKRLKKFLDEIKKEHGGLPKDLHITRKAMAFVAISEGRVVKAEEPLIKNCPLFKRLFDAEEITREQVVKKFNWQIENLGMFSCHRDLTKDRIIVPFGASEILMYAIKRSEIDAAVIVCEGAGTVITANPSLIQAIGAYQNGIFYTTPIEAITKKIIKLGGSILSDKGKICQLEGIKKAFTLGHRKIAVTVRGDESRILRKIREFEKKNGISVTILVVCNSGISREDSLIIKEHSDLVWSCGSRCIREIVGPDSILQLGMKIPVFALNIKGLSLIASYSGNIDPHKFIKSHYITANKYMEGAREIKMGRFKVFLYPTDHLPVTAEDEPSPLV